MQCVKSIMIIRFKVEEDIPMLMYLATVVKYYTREENTRTKYFPFVISLKKVSKPWAWTDIYRS